MQFKVEVTQADIDAAIIASCGPAAAILCCCPVAQALRRHLKCESVQVGIIMASTPTTRYSVVPEDEDAMSSFTRLQPEEWSTRCKPATLHFNGHHF